MVEQGEYAVNFDEFLIRAQSPLSRGGGHMRLSLIFVPILLANPAVAAERAPLPGWMAGCWIQQQSNSWTEECWTAPRAGSMLGSGRRGRGEMLSSWETMQIFADQPNGDGPTIKLGFWGAPNGKNRTLFAASKWSASEVVFFNLAHDYPQRVRYWREGALLKAEISLADGSKAVRFDYRPMGNGQAR